MVNDHGEQPIKVALNALGSKGAEDGESIAATLLHQFRLDVERVKVLHDPDLPASEKLSGLLDCVVRSISSRTPKNVSFCVVMQGLPDPDEDGLQSLSFASSGGPEMALLLLQRAQWALQIPEAPATPGGSGENGVSPLLEEFHKLTHAAMRVVYAIQPKFSGDVRPALEKIADVFEQMPPPALASVLNFNN